MRRLLLSLLAGAALAAPVSARAQIGSFGQNKIQYQDFDWHVLAGEHVDVYYYPAEESIARVALSYAEESYDVLSQRLNHRIEQRIPLIVYASHSHFEQTNILPFVPPEGILGVTEFMKRRVALPFRGSYSEFRHTLRHELVHVFHLSMMAQQAALAPAARLPALPLWWTEGLAEYFSAGQETRDEMVLRALSLSGRLPTIDQLNATYSSIVYPVGGELHRFLGETYGDWRVNLLYSSLNRFSTFDEALAATYGRTPSQLTSEWQYAMRQRFFPAVVGRRPFGVAARLVTELALKPVPVRRADGGIDVLYLSPRSGYTDIYRHPLDGSSEPEVVVQGERSPELESLHAASSRIDVREQTLLFASKYHDRDALLFWDLEKKELVGRYQFDDIVSIVSPSWSPDGERVAFNGLSNSGVSDLYVFEMRLGTLSRVTADIYEDLDPVWLPGGDALVFASDRAHGGEDGAHNLYRVSLLDRRVTPLTHGRWIDESPRWDPDEGRILFASDRDGTFNLYSVDTLGSARRETVLDGGVFDPVPIPGDHRVLVSGFENFSWSIFMLAPDSAAHTETFAIAGNGNGSDSTGAWHWAELNDAAVASIAPSAYRRSFSLDVAAGGSDVGPGWGAAQGAQVLFTDLLGDHAVAASVSMYSRGGGIGDVLSNLNGNVFYLNQKERLNWGMGAFRLSGIFYEQALRRVYEETTGGVYGMLRYPFSRFTRIEGQTRLEYSNRDDGESTFITGDPQRRGFLVSNYLSLVGDNSLSLSTGPIDGMRWNLTAGVVGDVTHGVFENWLGTVDVRKYVRTSQQSAVALRAYAYASEGTRPRAVQIGGSWMLRGYPRYAVDGTRAWLLNSEWRFPVMHYLTLGFPFGSLRLPQVQGAVFGDLGQAWYGNDYDERILGSAGVGFRLPLIPGFVLRMDVGQRFSFRGDPAGADIYKRRFAEMFFGFNY